MTTWIAFFRGINVGGNNLLPMKSVPALLEKCGCRESSTYIQSGNIVFRSAEVDRAALGARISAQVRKGHGFEPRVLLLTVQELARAIERNPYPRAREYPKTVHLYFLEKPPARDGLVRLEEVKANGDEFLLEEQVFYLHTPAGLNESKVAQRSERALGVSATARNWRTCITVLEMARALENRALESRALEVSTAAIAKATRAAHSKKRASK